MNGIAAQGFAKMSLIQGYIIERIICLSETFLNSSLSKEDDRLKIEGYNLISSDSPSGFKKRGVCVYYKEHILLIRRDDLCTLNNCFVAEIYLENKNASLSVSNVHQVKVSTNLKIFVQTYIFL